MASLKNKSEMHGSLKRINLEVKALPVTVGDLSGHRVYFMEVVSPTRVWHMINRPVEFNVLYIFSIFLDLFSYTYPVVLDVLDVLDELT